MNEKNEFSKDHEVSFFIKVFDEIQAEVHETAKEKGWYDEKRNLGELIALTHGELSEALEAIRKNTWEMSEKIPDYTEFEEELADVIIRVMDMAEYYGSIDLVGAILAKIKYNKTRPHKHGGKNF